MTVTEFPRRSIDNYPLNGEMLKPGELIDAYSPALAALSKEDHLTFNLLVKHAWGPELAEVGHQFMAPTSCLRASGEGDNRRLKARIKRLQQTLVDIRSETGYTTTTQLLGSTTIETKDTRTSGAFFYTFPSTMAAVLSASTVFAKLEMDVLRLLSSKYSVSLYEALCRRVNMRATNESLSAQQMREVVCLEPGKYKVDRLFQRDVIRPALREINLYSDYGCDVLPMTTGRRLTGYQLFWHHKDEDARRFAFKARAAAFKKVEAPEEASDSVLED